MRDKTLQQIAPEQYGFMPDKGTHTAIFVSRRKSDRSIEKQKDIMHVSLTTTMHLIQ